MISKLTGFEKAQLTYGYLPTPEGKWKYDMVFFFADSEDTFSEQGLSDRFNYFTSKSSFESKEECIIYADAILSFIEVYLVNLKDAASVGILMNSLLSKQECPENIKDSVEKTYASKQLKNTYEQSSSEEDPIFTNFTSSKSSGKLN